MALESTQPLTGVFPGGKGGRYVRLTTLLPSCAVVLKSGNLNFLEPSGPLQGSNGTALPFYKYRAETRSHNPVKLSDVLNLMTQPILFMYQYKCTWGLEWRSG